MCHSLDACNHGSIKGADTFAQPTLSFLPPQTFHFCRSDTCRGDGPEQRATTADCCHLQDRDDDDALQIAACRSSYHECQREMEM